MQEWSLYVFYSVPTNYYIFKNRPLGLLVYGQITWFSFVTQSKKEEAELYYIFVYVSVCSKYIVKICKYAQIQIHKMLIHCADVFFCSLKIILCILQYIVSVQHNDTELNNNALHHIIQRILFFCKEENFFSQTRKHYFKKIYCEITNLIEQTNFYQLTVLCLY